MPPGQPGAFFFLPYLQVELQAVENMRHTFLDKHRKLQYKYLDLK